MPLRRLFVLVSILGSLLSSAHLSFAGVGFQPISPEELKMTSEPKAPGAPAIILYRQVDRDDSGNTAHEDNYYRVKILTEEGRKELHHWLESPSRLDLDLRNETFLKLILARRLADANPLQVLAVERRSCFARLHEVTQAKADAQRDGASVQTMLLLDLAILRLEAFLKWLERCEEILQKECKA